jgi:oligopeptide/dipeptide ABC transporter ATP-binding protein
MPMSEPAPTSGASVLTVRDMHKSFPIARSLGDVLGRRPARSLRAVDGVSLDVRRGEVLGVVGESGCGKTTLAHCIMRLTPPDSGSVRLDDTDFLALGRHDLRRARRRIQMVFQDPYTSLSPRLTIGDAIAEAAIVHEVVRKDSVGTYVNELLELVGLPASAARRRPRELSGGQRQRVAIARALAVKPEVLIADEAVSALDVSIQAQVLNLLRRLTDELGLATIFIGHQLAVIAHVSDRVAIMYLGQVVESGATAHVFEHPQHPYTRALLRAHPELGAERRERRDAVSGDIPSPLDMPSGCRFRTRCEFAQERCKEPPPVVDVGPGHEARCAVLPFRDGPAA